MALNLIPYLRLVGYKASESTPNTIDFHFAIIIDRTISASEFTFDSPFLTASVATPLGSNLTVSAQFNGHIEGSSFIISYSPTESACVHTHMVTTVSDPNGPLLLYIPVGSIQIINNITVIGNIIQYLYLLLFAASLLCTKIIGAETIYTLHLSYYCLIPLGVMNTPFLLGFTAVKHISGWNPLFSGMQQTPVALNYSVLGIRSNFLSNVNLMLLPLVICPVLSPFLYLASTRSKSFRGKPRLVRSCKAFLL